MFFRDAKGKINLECPLKEIVRAIEPKSLSKEKAASFPAAVNFPVKQDAAAFAFWDNACIKATPTNMYTARVDSVEAGLQAIPTRNLIIIGTDGCRNGGQTEGAQWTTAFLGKTTHHSLGLCMYG